MIKLIAIILIAYSALCLGMFLFQRRIVFRPEIAIMNPHDFKLDSASRLSLETTDSVKLTAWYIAPKGTGYPTMVYFHGNKGHIGDRAEKLRAFSQLGLGILAISYRGYGDSKGTPTEQGLYEDGRAALRYLIHNLALPLDHIVIYGESLGSGVAVHMATEFPVKAIMLEAPYSSILDLAHENYPFIPTSLLLRDKFLSIRKIRSVHAPLLIMHGAEDQTIPIKFGKELYGVANEPKKAVFFDHYHHTDFEIGVLATCVKQFLQHYKALPEDTIQP
ncbi:MAG: alpha/beta hydrolase [Alphaproteobacteria bacterium]|nr:alpha/beta hydrolase [Alphaproteobacteria bacterium]